MAGIGVVCPSPKMLDADSLFERLLREAANLVPKMSTPKLTNALKVTSSLQQKITDTVASRLPQEKSQQINDVFRQQLSVEAVMSQGVQLESDFLTDSNDQTRRVTINQWDGNYGGLTLFPQLNNLGNATSFAASKDVADSATSEVSTFGYPAGTLFSPMNTMTAVMSSGAAGCGALLVPLVAGSHGTAILHPTNASNSSQLPDSSVIMTAGNVSSTGATTINFLHPNNALALHNANFKSALKNDSNRNGQIQCIKDSVDMKPEPPLDCFGRRQNVNTSSQSGDLTPVEFSQLAPISQSFGIVSNTSTLTTTTTTTTPVTTSATTTTTTSTGLISRANNMVLSPLPSTDSLIMVTCCSDGNTTVTTNAINTTSSLNTTPTAASTKALHSGNGPYRCRECDKEFRILRYLEKHRRIHTGEKPYQCCYCGRQFNDWPNMNRHKRIHTGERPYRCTVCTKTFSQPAVYNEHVKRHTGERPYICTVCAKGFPRAARLAVHMRVHTGERPYPCTSCDRRFSQPHHLAAHLRVHSGDRPYSCPKCDVSFACISNLRRHRKQVHPTSPIPLDQADATKADDKKPSLQCLVAASISSSTAVSSSAGSLALDPSVFLATSAVDNSVALAAAMSGTVLTATGALVPANFLPASSIPGLILTSGGSGALIAAAPHQLTDHQSQLHPALIAHNSVHQALNADGATTFLTNSFPVSLAGSSATPNAAVQSETFLKANSLMLPTVLTSSTGPVAFFTPSGELDRSCTATLAAAPHDGSLVVNSVDGETVYLEPLDPRLALESGHQFTLTTIPTSHQQSVSGATIFHPQHSTHAAQLVGHSIQLQSHNAQIAFASPQASQMLAPNSGAIFQPTNASPGSGQLHTNQPSATLIFSSHSQPPQQPHSMLQQTSIESGTTPTQLIHYHHHHQQQQQQQNIHPHRSVSGINILPGRPASTPTQQANMQQQHQQTAMLVPIVHTPPVTGTLNSSNASTSSDQNDLQMTSIHVSSNPNWSMNSGTFVTLNSSHLCPVSSTVSMMNDDQTEVAMLNAGSSRPSSVLSNSSSSIGGANGGSQNLTGLAPNSSANLDINL